MIDIIIYGPESSSFEYVKLMLNKLLDPSMIEFNITENHKVDDYIKIGIESVPAVQINNHLFFEKKNNEPINSFIRKIVQSILKEENYGKMKKIIVPIDFSESSINAFYYAQNLINRFTSIIRLVHVYHPNPVDIQGQVFIDTELEKIQREKLNLFVESFNQDWIGDMMTTSLVDGEFIIGFPVPELLNLSEREDTKFLVMGSKGDDQILRKWFGSVSSEIAQRSSCPVFIIPPNTSFQPYRNILYATNDAELDSECLSLVTDIAKVYDANIHLVHVKDNHNYPRDFDLMELMKTRYPKSKIKDKVVVEDSIVEGLNHYASKYQVDLLVLATRHKRFWSRLFYKSTTKNMVIDPGMPLLIFHKGDKI